MASRSLVQVNTQVTEIISIFDISDAPVTGLVTGDFTTYLYHDAVEVGPTDVPITITEIGDGQYKVEFTPDSSGIWHWRIAEPTYGPRGWEATYQATVDGVLIASIIRAEIDANSTKLDATVSSRATNTGVRTEMDANSTKLANLDDTISSRAQPGDAMTLTSGERATLSNAIMDLADAIDGLTPRELFKLLGAVLLGKVTGGPSTPSFRSLDDSVTRVTAVADSDGNRTSVTLNP